MSKTEVEKTSLPTAEKISTRTFLSPPETSIKPFVGFGLVLDGSAASDAALTSMLFWDVNNGIARRAWAKEAMKQEPLLMITMPNKADEELVNRYFD